MNRRLVVGLCALLALVLVVFLGMRARRKQLAPAPGNRVVVTPDGKLMPVPNGHDAVWVVGSFKGTNNVSVSNASAPKK